MWYVYFLRLTNEHIYVGSTNDLQRRLSQHLACEVKSTAAYQPAALGCYLAVHTRVCARRLERYFKSGSGKAFAKKRLLMEP